MNEIILYKSDDGKLSFDVKLDSNTIWLTQSQIAELFEKSQQNISLHIKNIFKEEELDEKSVHKYFLYTASDSKKYNTKHYNLDVIISVGYRVKSKRGTQFRIWATSVLREHLLKGYSVNKYKLKRIEQKIDRLLEKEDLQDEQIKQLHEEQKFIKKIAQPNPIVNKIYINNKSLAASQENIKEHLKELNIILREIETKLPTTSALKVLISDIKENANKAPKNPEAKNRLLKTITDLGDQGSSINKMLAAAGIAQNIIKKTYEIGLFLIKHLVF